MEDDSTISSTPPMTKKKVELTKRIQFGGVLKELKNQTEEPPTHPVFLEAIYWMKR